MGKSEVLGAPLAAARAMWKKRSQAGSHNGSVGSSQQTVKRWVEG